jgi:hypothetical protein
MDDVRVKEVNAGSVEEPRFLKVENLTASFVTLLHPSLEDKRHRTIAPRRIALLDKVFKKVGDNQQLVDLGIIEWELTDALGADDGRQEALGPDHAMNDRQLEYLAQQILLFPEDNLDMRDGGAIRPGASVPDIPAMAYVIYELIVAAPRNEADKLVNVDYLKRSHLPMLENVLAREKMWRNRPAIVELLERRIGELRAMDSSGRVMGV